MDDSSCGRYVGRNLHHVLILKVNLSVTLSCVAALSTRSLVLV